MKTQALTLIAVLITPPALAETETRCGWYADYLSSNITLYDADSFWTISTYESTPTPGFEEAYTKQFHDREIVVTDAGSRSGYSCACVVGEFGPPGSRKVYAISRLKGLPLSQCKNDPKLPPDPSFAG
ncbi:DUF4087 domain-containing protein [Tabrizicola sp.]|uniref:DUF4087 domain-containing protein n=1 Tax=Tabrizicola sp. TaxID=2005166 RepID=UPI003F359FD1